MTQHEFDFILPVASSDVESQIFGGLSSSEKKQIEPAGRSFYRHLKAILGKSDLSNVTQQSSDHNQGEAEEETEEDRKEEEKYKHKKKTVLKVLEDYYEVLGLGELRWRATAEDIKKAYKKAVLTYHPDKQDKTMSTSDPEAEVFKLIQKAYETLSDPKKRRAYDSQEPFDDSIPSAESIKTPEDFYKIFGPVFERNSRWSIHTPVPKLGDENTPYEEVLNFYSFWYNFKSWRDFSYLDEYDPSEAETREEKRWMERRNARLQAKRKREEMQRITRLVDTAYKLDPRIRKYHEEQQARKERLKRERQEAIRKKKEEEERKMEEERKKKEEEERKRQEEAIQKKKEKEKMKKTIKKRRQQIRQFCEKTNYSTDRADLLLCNVDSLEKLNAIWSAIERSQEEGIRVLDNEVELLLQEIRKKEQSVSKSSSSKSSTTPSTTSQEEGRAWTADELHLLSRALARYPTGTPNRWQVIADFIGTRTVKEVIAKVKHVQQEELKTQPQTRELESQFARWQREKEKKLSTSKKIDLTPSQRFDDVKTIAEVSLSTLRELEGRAEETGFETIKSTNTQTETKMTPSQSSEQKTQPNEKLKPRENVSTKEPNREKVNKSSDPANWTSEEQKALECALKKYPQTLPDRWDKIAKEVPGRSKKECIMRYKYLVEIIKKKK